MQSKSYLEGRSFFASWSGSKDSCLALYRAIRAEAKPAFLFTMLTEDGDRSHSHGLAREVILAQASALQIPVIFRIASWQDYEAAFLDGLKELNSAGATVGVFGDIDIDQHLQWVKRGCATAGVMPHEPLWQGSRRELLAEFLSADFEAVVVSVKDDRLPKDVLGRVLDWRLIEGFEAAKVDVSGENGEYHTVVTDGPIFSQRLQLERKEAVLRSSHWFLDLGLADDPQSREDVKRMRQILKMDPEELCRKQNRC